MTWYLSTHEVIITSVVGLGHYHFFWVDKSMCQPISKVINCILLHTVYTFKILRFASEIKTVFLINEINMVCLFHCFSKITVPISFWQWKISLSFWQWKISLSLWQWKTKSFLNAFLTQKKGKFYVINSRTTLACRILKINYQ